MSDQQQIPIDALVARHQEQNPDVLTNEDAVHIAGLFKTVGNELHTVDHHQIGGSSKRALQLEQSKVFNVPVVNEPPPQAHQQYIPPQEPTPEPVPQPEQSVVEQKIEPVESTSASDLDDRISKLEKAFSRIIKPPHKKVNVKYKSENISGVFDNFEDVVDALRKSLNKSAKRITITLNEN